MFARTAWSRSSRPRPAPSSPKPVQLNALTSAATSRAGYERGRDVDPDDRAADDERERRDEEAVDDDRQRAPEEERQPRRRA